MRIAKRRIKVPLVLQMEAAECGLASLSMVLAYYGKWVPLEQMRFDCGISRDGMRGDTILRAAAYYGLVAKAYRMNLNALRKASLPAVIHWEFNHFVVVCGVSDTSVWINDPAEGVRKIPMEQFGKSYTGIAFTFRRAEDFVSDGRPPVAWRQIKGALHGNLGPALYILLTELLAAMVGLAFPLGYRFFIDVVENNGETLLPAFLSVLLIAAGAEFVLQSCKAVYLMKVRRKLSLAGSASFFWHLMNLPLSYFTSRYAGDLAGRQMSCEKVSQVLTETALPFFLNGILLVVYGIFMLVTNLKLSIIGILAVCFNLACLFFQSRALTDESRKREKESGRLNGSLSSRFSIMETIKSNAAVQGLFEQFCGSFARAYNARVRCSERTQAASVWIGALTKLANALVLIAGVYLILFGQLTIGALLSFQSFLSGVLTPAAVLLETGATLGELQTQTERVEDVLRHPMERTASASIAAQAHPMDPGEKLTGEIVIEHLTFGYDRLSPPLFEDLCLRIPAGAMTALVGGSGSGKSTLWKLILGLYEPWEGKILFDGMPRLEIPEELFASSVAVVDQDIALFDDTIEANLTMWDDEVLEADMMQAAKDAQIHETIMGRSGDYRARVKQGGRNFSGGQAQRLELARALTCNPSVLILDEATSAVDAPTERSIMEAVHRRDCTCLVIAHRLHILMKCDQICVMDRGKIVERGTHAELIHQEGLYARQFRSGGGDA